ncbi:MAG: hydantoinase B/oxoprolinase family protein [Phycisphaerales bacterium]|nr:hydantoinase B/oxoprolinase family protein [Phycisphaerales bacterium]
MAVYGDQIGGGNRSEGGGRWLLRIDTGGTFTDAYAVDPSGVAARAKVLSSGRVRARATLSPDGELGLESTPAVQVLNGVTVRPLAGSQPIGHVATREDGSMFVAGCASDGAPPEIVDLDPNMDAPRLAMHVLTRTPIGGQLPPIDLRIATTRATNALLTGELGSVLLVTNAGFEDLHIIGDQARPEIFALNPRPPRQQATEVVGIDARLAVDGTELRPLELEKAVASILDALKRTPCEVVAIAFMHAWRNPEHERQLAAALRETGIGQVFTSHDRSPGIRLVPRVRTLVADASLAPVIEGFLDQLVLAPPRDRVQAMTSSGGLVAAANYRPAESLLSGPAAGVVGAVAAAEACGFSRILGFDMGGTSTDVCRHAGRSDLRDETQVANATVRVPSIDLHTVAAGGGSICSMVDGRLEVGPASAGAEPGPACYGAGGPLTLTDVNLLEGRVDTRRFRVPLDEAASERAFAAILEGSGREREELLDGFRALAEERMAEAIRTVSTRRGEDPADHALVAFGGAGGQHACGIARRLGITKIVIPADTGLLSAIGLHCAVRERFSEQAVLAELGAAPLVEVLRTLEAAAIDAAATDGVASAEVVRRQVRCRLLKQDATIDLECGSFEEATDVQELASRFAVGFEKLYGYPPPERPIEVAAIRVFAGEIEGANLPAPSGEAGDFLPEMMGRFRADGMWVDASMRDRGTLSPGERIVGPGIVAEDTSTVVIEPGWTLQVHSSGGLLLEFEGTQLDNAIDSAAAGEIVACRLESIARDMGETLRRTALSVNVKERLDYSCGILDAHGRLVVNAPHMPVHLGALGVCVRSVAEHLPLAEGDVALVNHPAHGGSHLPDLTVITPVFETGELLGYVANRAHHAEIGGTRPGSMPPDATTLEEEGVVFAPVRIVEAGARRFDVVERLLVDARHPTRALSDNLADLEAQVAANHLGATRLRQLRRDAGADRFAADLDQLRDRCMRSIRQTADRLEGVDRSEVERLDDGSELRLRLTSGGGRLRFDFSGSAGVHPRNLNAPHAITRAAVLYALRLVSTEEVPLNEGALEVVDIEIPEGILSPRFTGDPSRDPAVAIGNTETSQRVVDLLLRTLDAVAGSQGTMNNTLIGDETFAYYETVCGGAGAGRGFNGCDAVHTHMTNTRITDPEILELRVPVRLERFAIRAGSGGQGQWRGGDGVVRELAALAPLSLSLLSQHRVEAPYGLDGGNNGERGRQSIIRADGKVKSIEGIAAVELMPGDTMRLETPGGGGCGSLS